MSVSSQLMLFAEDSPAKTYQLPANKKVSRRRGQDYGRNSKGLLASYCPHSQSWKTFQICFLEKEAIGLAPFSETWPRSGTMQNGIAYQLATLEPATHGTEYGLLPTPLATCHKGAPKHRYFGSETYKSNLAEALRNSKTDPIYPHPDFVVQMMGFPNTWLD